MNAIDKVLEVAVDWAWGRPLLVLLVGGGLLLTLYSRLLPFTRLRHAFHIVRGKYDDEHDPGQITHFQALTTALSSTIGLGNIGGVAIAVTQGGPGAVFWMWVTAVVGMATKFFTCTLAVLYRGVDHDGVVQGGPMYYIEGALGPRAKPLAMLFAAFGVVGCLAMFQTNQLAEILTEAYQVNPWITGAVSVSIVAAVTFGGIARIGAFASRVVPVMCITYFVGVFYILATRFDALPGVFAQIIHDAFNGTAAVAGVAGIAFAKVLQTGVKRAAFSNEAGLGTAPMAHGAAKTDEPVREGLVAMVGPAVDTLLICSLTAFAILSSGLWQGEEVKGVALTLKVFEGAMGQVGKVGLVVVVVMFSLSTMVGYSYYGRKCFKYLFGPRLSRGYDVLFLIALFVGAVWSAGMVVNLLDTAFALMAWPNMVATLLLAPRVMKATRAYFTKMDASGAT